MLWAGLALLTGGLALFVFGFLTLGPLYGMGYNSQPGEFGHTVTTIWFFGSVGLCVVGLVIVVASEVLRTHFENVKYGTTLR